MSGSDEWLRTRTKQQLREYIDGSYPGVHQDAARAELRDRESVEEAGIQRVWIKRTFWATLILGLVGIAVALLKG
jgi:hypothetical protein